MWLIVFIFAAFCAAVVLTLGGFLVLHLSPEEERKQNLRKLWPWLAKGFGLPLMLWALMNFGITWWLRPFMPSVQYAQMQGSWFGAFLQVMAVGVCEISTYWLAVTLGWTLYKASRGIEGETRTNFRALCATSLIGMALPAVFLVFIGGWHTLGLALAALQLPIAGYGPSVLKRAKKKPMYSAAIARMKFGKYAEAEWEIIKQLENAENDHDGWLMLAELYATHFRDLGEAEQIILEVCDQPKVTPSQISVALHKLADWHIKIGGDPDAARRALQVISNRMPGSHLARMAAARSAQLPQTAEDLRDQTTAAPIPMPALSDNFDAPPGEAGLDTNEATATARQLIERLNRNPNDVAVRERLARLLADPLGQVDTAIDQLQALLGMANQPEGKRAEWFALMAAWQFKHKQDPEAAQAILERLLRDHPDSPQASAAQRRLNLLRAEKQQGAARPERPKIKIVPD